MADTKTRVLLADDEMHIRMMLKTVINSIDCEVVAEASNGKEAVTLFKEKRPDLVLLDINMPLQTGEEALKEIIEEFPSALVIMLTSVTDMESVERCIDAGACNYIRKDTPLVEMKALVSETIALHKGVQHA